MQFFTDKVASLEQIRYDQLHFASNSIHDQLRKLWEVGEVVLAFDLSD